MAISVKRHHQKAQLGVLFLAADSVFRGTDRSSVKMDLNRSTPPPQIYSVHRWMVVISRYVAMLAETSQLTVGIRRGRLRSPAMVVAEMGNHTALEGHGVQLLGPPGLAECTVGMAGDLQGAAGRGPWGSWGPWEQHLWFCWVLNWVKLGLGIVGLKVSGPCVVNGF